MTTKRITWFSVDSRMPHDPKLSSFDNDYRWAWVCLMALEKRGELEDQDILGFAHYCHIDQDKFREVLKGLQLVGLLDDRLRPKDFDDWQDRVQKNERQKRYRDSKVTRESLKSDGRVTVECGGETEKRPSYTDTDTDTKKNKNHAMSSSGQLDLVPASNLPAIMDPTESQITEILEHFKATTGKTRVSIKSESNRRKIRARLTQDGIDPSDLKAVIDLKTQQTNRGEFQAKYLRVETLFNSTKCQSYLAELDGVQEQPQESPTSRNNRLTLARHLSKEATL